MPMTYRLRRFLAVLGLISSFLSPETLPACRYNVRDVGFVDLGRTPPFRLDLYTDANTAPAFVKRFQETASAVFLDANVEARIVSTADAGSMSDPALEAARRLRVSRCPQAFLIGPRERALEFPVAENLPRDKLWERLEALITSKTRSEALEGALEAYAVVLLVEGSRGEANGSAREAAEEAIRRVKAQLRTLPKTIREPPRLLSLPAGRREKERILLWALGIDSAELDGPRAAVIYGRLRLMGPVLEGRGITSGALYDALRIIGQSCECDLDRRWMRGHPLPLRWSREARSRASRLLGFDPENPLVKTEISRILSRGRNASPSDRAADMNADDLLGYSETVVDLELDDGWAKEKGILSDAELDALIADAEGESAEDTKSQDGTEAGSSTGGLDTGVLLITTALLMLTALVGGLAVFLRSRARA